MIIRNQSHANTGRKFWCASSVANNRVTKDGGYGMGWGYCTDSCPKTKMNKKCDVLQIHDSANPNVSHYLNSHSDEEQYLMWWSKENGWTTDFRFPENFRPNILITESCWNWKKATPDCYPTKSNFQENKNINCQTEPNKAKWIFLIEDLNNVTRPRCFENNKSFSVVNEEEVKSSLKSGHLKRRQK